MSKKSKASVRARRAEQLARQRRRRYLYYGLAIAGAILIVGFFALARQFTTPTLEDVVIPESLEAPPEADGKAWGPPDAPVLVEEFSDFQ